MKLTANIAILLCLGLVLLSAAAQSETPEKTQPVQKAASPWAFEPDPKLPNVLLLGDSISIGYTLDVRKLLKGKANVFRPMLDANRPENCSFTANGLNHIDNYLGTTRWDVIHFNWGLHDVAYLNDKDLDTLNGKMRYSIEEYEANLEKIVARLQKTNAKLIWCATTAIPEDSAGRKTGDEVRYNAAAAKIMEKHHIPINDLYSVSKTLVLEKESRKANVHFYPIGSEKLAKVVVEHIQKELEKQP